MQNSIRKPDVTPIDREQAAILLLQKRGRNITKEDLVA
jgi:hypothetical protein